MITPPTDEAEAMARRLVQNAAFLRRKGWSKSADMEDDAAALIRRLAERQGELERALREMIDTSDSLIRQTECGELHHTPKQYHSDGPCLVLLDLYAKLGTARKALKGAP